MSPHASQRPNRRKALPRTRHTRRRVCHAIYRREEVLERFAEAVRELGEDVTQAQFTRFAGLSEGPIQRLFGSWAALRATHGLGPTQSRQKSRRFTREVILQHLRASIAKRGPDLSVEEFLEDADMSYRTLARWFRGWRNLREAAGLPRISSQPHGNSRYNRPMIVAAFETFVASDLFPKSAQAFEREHGIPRAAVLRHFGSWDALWRTAGLAPPSQRRYSDEQLLDEYLRVRQRLGRPPKGYEFDQLSPRSWGTLLRWLGPPETIERQGYLRRLRQEAARRGLELAGTVEGTR